MMGMGAVPPVSGRKDDDDSRSADGVPRYITMTLRRLISIVFAMIATFGVVHGSAAATVSQGPDPDPEHPYSEPFWLPVRNPTRIGCVKTNCPGPFHGYDAIDLTGERGDPIYAAGAGVFHIGSTDRTCPTDGPSAGVWVWVDHGAAGRTRYYHLDTIEAEEGQLVTPNTIIGTMGGTGQKFPCQSNYLHFEYRTNTNSSTRIPLRSLRACVDGDTVVLPEALGYEIWDDVPFEQRLVDRVPTPAADNSCMPASWSSTPDQPSTQIERGVERLTAIPSNRPADVDSVHVRLEQYHPTIPGYGSRVDRTVSPDEDSITFDGLTAGKTYRIRVAFHNDHGWSEWSDDVTAVPGVFPVPPSLRELDTTITTLGYKWHREPNLDAEYDVRIRAFADGEWSTWTQYSVEAPAISYRFRQLVRNTTYQVQVRARNDFGVSDWAEPQTIKTAGCRTECVPTLEAPAGGTLVPAARGGKPADS